MATTFPSVSFPGDINRTLSDTYGPPLFQSVPDFSNAPDVRDIFSRLPSAPGQGRGQDGPWGGARLMPCDPVPWSPPGQPLDSGGFVVKTPHILRGGDAASGDPVVTMPGRPADWLSGTNPEIPALWPGIRVQDYPPAPGLSPEQQSLHEINLHAARLRSRAAMLQLQEGDLGASQEAHDASLARLQNGVAGPEVQDALDQHDYNRADLAARQYALRTGRDQLQQAQGEQDARVRAHQDRFAAPPISTLSDTSGSKTATSEDPAGAAAAPPEPAADSDSSAPASPATSVSLGQEEPGASTAAREAKAPASSSTSTPKPAQPPAQPAVEVVNKAFGDRPPSRADIDKLLASPEFQKLQPQERQQALNEALTRTAQQLAPGWNADSYQAWRDFAQQKRDQVATMKTWGETGRQVGGWVLDAATGMLRMVPGVAVDSQPINPDGSLHLPFSNIREQLWHNSRRIVDSLKTGAANFDLTGAPIEDELNGLKARIDAGQAPLHDEKAFHDWYQRVAGTIQQAQSDYYNGIQRDGSWDKRYLDTNGLYNKANAALLASYISTGDPEAWKQLRNNLLVTPRRAQIDNDQAQSLANSPVAKFLHDTLGPEYAEALKDAGDPVTIAALVLPLLRGGALVSAGERSVVKELVKGLIKDTAIGTASTATQNPNATWDDYVEGTKRMLATSLGMHAAGAATSAVIGGVTGVKPGAEPEPAIGRNAPLDPSTRAEFPFAEDAPGPSQPGSATEAPPGDQPQSTGGDQAPGASTGLKQGELPFPEYESGPPQPTPAEEAPPAGQAQSTGDQQTEQPGAPEPEAGAGGNGPTRPPITAPEAKQTLAFNTLEEFRAATTKPGSLHPSTRYEFGGKAWITDELGRVAYAEGDLIASPHGRVGESLQTKIGNEGDFKATDVGFHLIGDQFDGPINRLNVVQGDGKLNGRSRGLGYGDMETEWRQMLEKGHPVRPRIRIEYEGDSLRPSRFYVDYENSEGITRQKEFANAPPLH